MNRMRLSVLFLALFVVVAGSLPVFPSGRDLLLDAIVKLILKYEELEERLDRVERRLRDLEFQGRGRKGDMEVDTREWAMARTWLRLRSGPGTEYRKILTLRPREVVEVLRKRGRWWKVKTREGFRGYVDSRYLVEVEGWGWR